MLNGCSSYYLACSDKSVAYQPLQMTIADMEREKHRIPFVGRYRYVRIYREDVSMNDLEEKKEKNV
ncbi:hypothetical protein N7450_004719 [Penicillium hetheringtonii]|uniref:Uncharacterized protein n=1 Tax=Penicillium hetheringtonii TaxID=911720 RepID=A0AAD6GVE2_9EURO|nr:hypothetical protein N7450_004719 [Penicillium hetheringtonii]